MRMFRGTFVGTNRGEFLRLLHEFSSYWIATSLIASRVKRRWIRTVYEAFVNQHSHRLHDFTPNPPAAIYLNVLPRSLIPRECRSQSVSDSIIYSRSRGYKESWLEYRNAIYIDALYIGDDYRGWMEKADGKFSARVVGTGSKSLLETSEINVGRTKVTSSNKISIVYSSVNLFYHLSILSSMMIRLRKLFIFSYDLSIFLQVDSFFLIILCNNC